MGSSGLVMDQMAWDYEVTESRIAGYTTSYPEESVETLSCEALTRHVGKAAPNRDSYCEVRMVPDSYFPG